jgi:cell division protein FtsQ
LIIAASVVLVLLAAAIFVYNSEIFAVKQVRTEGANHLTTEHLTMLAEVPVDTTLLKVDADGICSRLKADPWVKNASVNREFPNTLVLMIEERPITAQVEIIPEGTSSQFSRWLLSDDSVWLGMLGGDSTIAAVSADEVAKIPMIKDVSRTLQPELGAKVSDEGVLNALAILNGFSAEMRALVASISAPDKSQTTLNLLNNVSVAFGAADEIAAKETAIITLLNAHAGSLTYINVRVPEHATYRASD